MDYGFIAHCGPGNGAILGWRLNILFRLVHPSGTMMFAGHCRPPGKPRGYIWLSLTGYVESGFDLGSKPFNLFNLVQP
jgi:hypothetical protein